MIDSAGLADGTEMKKAVSSCGFQFYGRLGSVIMSMYLGGDGRPVEKKPTLAND